MSINSITRDDTPEVSVLPLLALLLDCIVLLLASGSTLRVRRNLQADINVASIRLLDQSDAGIRTKRALASFLSLLTPKARARNFE
jgi:hypothetical protein